ncbi:MAG: hypothetical protein PHE01_01815 [Methanosarcina sp.]|jgi:hypothetical protein|nr:hypothetical protein [Methanosarcina sp.]
MPEYLVLKADIKIPNGPSMTLNRTLELDAYDKIDILVPTGQAGENKLIELQQSEETKIKFLLIKSDFYGKELSYKVNKESTTFVLDEPLVLTGKGAISLFGAVPKKLYFTNSTSGNEAKDIRIEVLVGRNMTADA